MTRVYETAESFGEEQTGLPARKRTVAVVGAGAAGLCAARHLLAAGCDVTIYEAASVVGGLWAYDNDGGTSSAYKTLHINTDKYITQFEDFPLSAEASVFPHHTEMRKYLEDYAEHFGLMSRVRFNRKVLQVSPARAEDGGTRWDVLDSEDESARFDTVVVANGHLSTPRMPDFAQDFTGDCRHSHHYRDPAEFVGRRICIVGAGNSACDIAADVCVTAARTVMAVRSGVTIVPKMIFGVPITQITTRLVRWHVPATLTRRVTRAITRIVHGNMSKWGFRAPDRATHPTSHATLISHIAYNRVAVRPGIKEVQGRRITFTDGSSEEFDTLITATGYKIHVPFVSDEVMKLGDEWAPLYKRVVPPEWPGLYFVGLIQYVGPLFKSFEIQGKWVASIESGQSLLPPRGEMHEDIDRKRQYNQEKFHGSARHALEEEAIPYQREIKQEIAEGRGRVRQAQTSSGLLPPQLADSRSIEPRQVYVALDAKEEGAVW
jgi:cation diffusion facilitator CzcD-associated flavoprotein CzcO